MDLEILKIVFMHQKIMTVQVFAPLTQTRTEFAIWMKLDAPTPQRVTMTLYLQSTMVLVTSVLVVAVMMVG